MLIITDLTFQLKICRYQIGRTSLTVRRLAHRDSSNHSFGLLIRVTLSPTTGQDNSRSGCVHTHSRAYARWNSVCENRYERMRARWIYDLDLRTPTVLGAGEVIMRKSVTNCRRRSRIRWRLKSALASHSRCWKGLSHASPRPAPLFGILFSWCSPQSRLSINAIKAYPPLRTISTNDNFWIIRGEFLINTASSLIHITTNTGVLHFHATFDYITFLSFFFNIHDRPGDRSTRSNRSIYTAFRTDRGASLQLFPLVSLLICLSADRWKARNAKRIAWAELRNHIRWLLHWLAVDARARVSEINRPRLLPVRDSENYDRARVGERTIARK